MFSRWLQPSEEYRDHFKPGVYVCTVCGNELFESGSKFAHNSPWPSFSQTVRPDSVRKVPERGSPNALKVYCAKCNNGLGHEFLGEGPSGKSRF